MHDVKHCTITAGKHSFAGLVVAELDWHEADTQTGHGRGYSVSDARLVEFPVMTARLNAYAQSCEPDDGVIDLEITIEIDGLEASTTLDGVIENGQLTRYTTDLIGTSIERLLDDAFNDD